VTLLNLDKRAVLSAPLYPTPVRACPELSRTYAELWIKNEGLSHAIYGGNKVRKAERLVAEAVRRGAKRVLSFGAAGSHHLLTLTLFARAAGLESAAFVFPQPCTEHALGTLRAGLGLGLELHPAQHAALIPWLVPRVRRRGDYLVAPGGSNALGTRACADAVFELSQQIAAGELPSPDLIVVPLGSGGTCAGIAAGVVRYGLGCRVLGVQVVGGFGPRVAARYLARETLRQSGVANRAGELETCLQFDATHVGPGYGAGSAAGARATAVARELGLVLDQTYTAKAFARVLELLCTTSSAQTAKTGRPLRILYWHTLSAAPLAPLLRSAPSEAELPAAVRRLLR
jgi:1-aminocyclopropane-1-carboxylate deaminase/D-cysteine desulfhydrase-like pyridoxal-dependent ACC family enzyme